MKSNIIGIILWCIIALAVYIPLTWALYDRDYPNKGKTDEGTMRILLIISGSLYALAGVSIYKKNIPFIYFFMFVSMIMEIIISYMMGPVITIKQSEKELLKSFEKASKEQLGISFDSDNYVELDTLLMYNTYMPFLFKLVLLVYASTLGVDYATVGDLRNAIVSK
jgi:hypothetical protein